MRLLCHWHSALPYTYHMPLRSCRLDKFIGELWGLFDAARPHSHDLVGDVSRRHSWWAEFERPSTVKGHTLRT